MSSFFRFPCSLSFVARGRRVGGSRRFCDYDRKRAKP